MRLTILFILLSFYGFSQVPAVGGRLSVPEQSTDCGDALIYYDGYFYHTIAVTNSAGITQCWLAENLHTDNYSYTNPTGNNNTWDSQQNYGYLYNYGDFVGAANFDPYYRSQGQCPSGYAVPSFYDFYRLTSAAGGDISNAATAWSELKLTEAISSGTSGKYWTSYAQNDLGDMRVFQFDDASVNVSGYDYTGNTASVRCIKNIRETPVVSTTGISNITTDGATISCNATSDSGYSITQRGIVYSSSNMNPQTFSDALQNNGSGTGSYSVTLSGLSANTTYRVRAYARNAGGDGIGVVLEFKTGSSTPSVLTSDVTNISLTTAQCGGNVVNDGGATVTARGVCWNTSGSPTLSNSYTSDGTGTGSFTSSITGLSASTAYYVRAYATNANGTIYGNEVSFITGTPAAPTVVLNSITNITPDAASVSSSVTNSGGATVTARGVCWNTSGSPTLSNSYTTDGSGTGTFSSSITGLSSGTTYYVRSYATNSTGTSYSAESSFTTQSTVACDGGNEYEGGQTFPTVINVTLGSSTGTVNFDFNARNVPDKFVVVYDGNTVINTGYRGLTSQQSALDAELTSRGESTETITSPGDGSTSFNKTTATTYATVYVYAPLSSTLWDFTLYCPE